MVEPVTTTAIVVTSILATLGLTFLAVQKPDSANPKSLCHDRPPKGKTCLPKFFYDALSSKCYHIPVQTTSSNSFIYQFVRTRCDAKSYCKERHATLPILSREVDSDFLFTRVPNAYYNRDGLQNYFLGIFGHADAFCYWIGLSKREKQTLWRWQNGKLLGKNAHWETFGNQPGVGNYAFAVSRYAKHKGYWHSGDNNTVCLIICQTDVYDVSDPLLKNVDKMKVFNAEAFDRDEDSFDSNPGIKSAFHRWHLLITLLILYLACIAVVLSTYHVYTLYTKCYKTSNTDQNIEISQTKPILKKPTVNLNENQTENQVAVTDNKDVRKLHSKSVRFTDLTEASTDVSSEFDDNKSVQSLESTSTADTEVAHDKLVVDKEASAIDSVETVQDTATSVDDVSTKTSIASAWTVPELPQQNVQEFGKQKEH